jgi:hypothetical protein
LALITPPVKCLNGTKPFGAFTFAIFIYLC